MTKLTFLQALYVRGLSQPSEKLIQEHNKNQDQPIVILEPEVLKNLLPPNMHAQLGPLQVEGRGKMDEAKLPLLQITAAHPQLENKKN